MGNTDDGLKGLLWDIPLWGVLCGAGALLVFLLKRHPVAAAISLGVVGVGAACIGFLGTIHDKSERSWFRYTEAIGVAVLSAASAIWLLRYACSCP